MKRTVILIMAGAVIGAVAMRPRCGTTVISTTAAAPRVATLASVPEPLAIASFAMPAASVSRRNVFAFRGEPRPPIAIRDVAPPRSTVATTTTSVEQQQVIVEQRPPDYNYVGSFGPQSMPILVYKGKGEVVNVPLRKP